MMHCTMDDVLALAAGEGSAWARQHVAGCAACRAELEALYQRVARLKALPARRPARDRWPAVRDAVLARVKQQSATLEQQLGRYDPDGRVTSGRSAALAAALEDRIAVIDGELAQLGPTRAQARPADLVTLWQQRVELMEQLMSVHVTRAAYVGL